MKQRLANYIFPLCFLVLVFLMVVAHRVGVVMGYFPNE